MGRHVGHSSSKNPALFGKLITPFATIISIVSTYQYPPFHRHLVSTLWYLSEATRKLSQIRSVNRKDDPKLPYHLLSPFYTWICIWCLTLIEDLRPEHLPLIPSLQLHLTYQPITSLIKESSSHNLSDKVNLCFEWTSWTYISIFEL